MSLPALDIAGLTVSHDGAAILRDISLRIERGRTHALVGESGSGKSLTGRACLGLLDRFGPRRVAGSIAIAGHEVTTLSERDLRRLRGDVAAMVFQEPLSSLDPCFSAGTQLAEAIRLHGGRASRRELARRLDAVGIERPRRRLADPPHRLSGGQRQRLMVAIAIANDPALLVADEPTTALDATLRRQILDLIDQTRRERDMGVLLITHDIGIVEHRADDISVLYSGAIVETGPTARILAAPRHPYTIALLASRPPMSGPRHALAAIPGQMPDPQNRPSGCAFRPRCRHATLQCEQVPPLEDGVACWYADRLSGPEPAAVPPPAPPATALPPAAPGTTGPEPAPSHAALSEALRLERVSKHYGPAYRAVEDVSLRLQGHTTLGIVGRSGSGKSTLGRLMLHLTPPSSGRVLVEGEDLAHLDAARLRRKRRRMQMVFQDPRASLDPRRSIADQIEEPLVVHGIGDRRERAARVARLLDLVGLPSGMAHRLPRRFSGGQLQRVAIARAIATDPVLLVADEPVASLDLSIQAQILDLFTTIRAELGLALVFISHDLAVIRHVSDEVAVMHAGRIVETGPVDTVLAHPTHEITRALLEA